MSSLNGAHPKLNAPQIDNSHIYMIRFGCEDTTCTYCRRPAKRPSVYAAQVFAQQYVMTGRKLCPRIAELFVPLVNFARTSVAPESLIMRVRCGKIPEVELPVAKPAIGINVRPQHVQKHKPKAKDAPKEKPVVNVGQFRLRRLNSQAMEKVLKLASSTYVRSLKSPTTPKTIPFYVKF